LAAVGGGQLWGPEYLSIAGASPINLAQLIPVANPAVFFSNPAVTNLNNTFTGTNTFTGANTFKNINNIRFADQFSGADCGAKINAADSDLGSIAGEIWVNQNCGTAWTTAVSLGASTAHVLRLIQGNVYTTSATVTVGENSGIVCGSPGLQFFTLGTPAKFCTIKQANAANLVAVIIMNGASSFLQDIVVDGNAANNPTAGVAVKGQDARFAYFNHVSIQNAKTHGLWMNSTAIGAGGGTGCCFQVSEDSIFSLNTIDGVYTTGASDTISQGQVENNGSTFTVNTTATSVTATSGSWSTDSSLIGSYIRVNTAATSGNLCQVSAVGSSTTLTVTNCVPTLGVLAGVPMSWGSGWEANNSPSQRFGIGCDFGGNKMDGFLSDGTTSGDPLIGSSVALGAFQNQIETCNLGNNVQHDIEFISASPASGTVIGWQNQVKGNVFTDGGSKTPNGVWDNIKCQDCYENDFTGNSYASGPASHQAKCAVEITETSANRAFPSQVGGILLTAPNSYTTTPPWGSATCDGTGQGNWFTQGNRVYTNGVGSKSALEFYDISTGNSRYIRGNNGGLDFVNTSFSAVDFALGSGGTISKYNNIGTSGNGIATIYGSTSQKAETGTADANVLTFTPPATVGTYRACVTVSVSSATAGVIGWTLSFTDSNGNAQSNIAQTLVQQGTAAPALTFTTSAAGNYQSCSTFDVNNAAANIVIKWVGGGTTAAKVSATVERII